LRIFNRYILLLVLVASIINGFLAFIGQDDLSVYFTVNVIAYLVITILHAYLNPRARKSLSTIAIVLFVGFMAMVIIKSIDIINWK
jgi:peptidoglycan/LPS O-acetylase OafA/YrhL